MSVAKKYIATTDSSGEEEGRRDRKAPAFSFEGLE